MSTDIQRQAFRRGATSHFTYPPDTWAVEKIAERQWCITRPDGARMDRYTTKKAARAGLTEGACVRLWKVADAWYRETSRDPRYRQLEQWQRDIVAEILAAQQ